MSAQRASSYGISSDQPTTATYHTAENSNVSQLRGQEAKLEDTNASKPPIVRSVLQRLSLGNESIWVRVGTLREALGDWNGAIEAYSNALRHSVDNPNTLCKIGSILLRRGENDKAFNYIQRVLSLASNNGEAWTLLGFYHMKAGAYEAAYEAFQNAVRLLGDQSSSLLWYGIGMLYELNNSFDYALEAFNNSLKLKPNSEFVVDIYLHMAHIYEEREALDLSYDYLNKAFLSISISNFNNSILADIYFRMGTIQEMKRKTSIAKEFYLKALKENPNHAKSLQQLGWVEHESGRTEEGFRLLRRAVEVDANDGQGWYLLGRLYMAQKEYRAAYDNYQHAVYCNSRNPRFWCSIGVLYYQMGQYRDAMDAYTRAIRLNPNLSEVWYDLGTLYESFSQFKDALDAYREALKLSPNNSQIKARVSEIEQRLKEETTTCSNTKERIIKLEMQQTGLPQVTGPTTTDGYLEITQEMKSVSSFGISQSPSDVAELKANDGLSKSTSLPDTIQDRKGPLAETEKEEKEINTITKEKRDKWNTFEQEDSKNASSSTTASSSLEDSKAESEKSASESSKHLTDIAAEGLQKQDKTGLKDGESVHERSTEELDISEPASKRSRTYRTLSSSSDSSTTEAKEEVSANEIQVVSNNEDDVPGEKETEHSNEERSHHEQEENGGK
eukprot:jgi/Galph1/252/GphlegSOOS_G4935.1